MIRNTKADGMPDHGLDWSAEHDPRAARPKHYLSLWRRAVHAAQYLILMAIISFGIALAVVEWAFSVLP